MAPKKEGSRSLAVTNNYYDLTVENSIESNGIGTYTVCTGDSHPATISMYGKQNVLYGGASGYPWSTYLSIKSYNSNTIYNTGADYYTPDSGFTTVQLDPYSSGVTQPTATSILCTWNVNGEIDHLRIEQKTFIDGTTLDDSKIGITTKVKNTGMTARQIGIRYEWDIQIADEDGTTMRTKNPEGPWLYYETQWSNFSYTHYEITDFIPSPTFYNLGSVIGPTYLTPPPTPPDLLTFASWPDSYGQAFNYTPTNQYLYGDDSAILYYWGDNLAHAITIAPGDSVMVTQYLFASLLTINYQVDNLIKNSTDASYIGDNIYNLSGLNQTKSQTVTPNNTAIYHVKIENDGTGQDGFNVQEAAPFDVGWNIQYFDSLTGGNNITAQVSSTGWVTGGLNPGQSREIRIEVTPDMTIPNGSILHTYLMSTSLNDNTKEDVVQAITTAGTYHDVGATQIIAPVGNITAGTNVTPKTIVENFGNFTETFDIGFTFFGYGDTQTVTNLAPGAIDTVEFANWTAVAGGYLESSFTMLSGDQEPSNNTAYMEFSVTGQVTHDVGVMQILAPTGMIPAGTLVIPAAIVHNFGSQDEVSIPVHFNFGTYSSTQTINLLVGQTDTIEFGSWTATVGNYNTIAYTALTGDINLYNDTAYGEFNVYVPPVHDVGVTAILSPTGSYMQGAVITPRAIVRNFGNQNESSLPVHFQFGAYNSLRTIGLLVGQIDTIDFDPWTATTIGLINTVSYTSLVGDNNASNDTVHARFTVTELSNRDVAVISILVPTDTAITCNDYTPQVVVANFGTVTELCTLNLTISRYPARMISYCHIGPDSTNIIAEYNTPVIIELAPGYDTIDMPTWHPYWWDIIWIVSPTNHHAFATISTDYDINLANNSALKPFIVKGRINDIQMNWTGLLDIDMPMHAETIGVKTYNVASVVSVSQGGTNARFRAYAKIIKENGNSIVYSRYKDLNLPAGTYYCVPFQSGWSPSATGWYKVSSWIAALPQYDAVTQNNSWEKRYYVTNNISRINNLDHTLQGNSITNPIPSAYGLMPNNPNPLSGYTKISWQAPENCHVNISVYDAAGRVIKTLVNNTFTAGYYNTAWNCTNEHGQKVNAGIYFYEMRTNSYTSRMKMVIAH